MHHRISFAILLISLLCILAACGKKKVNVDVIDLSIPMDVELNQIRKIGNQFLVVGGQRYEKSTILLLDENDQWQEQGLPSNSSHTSIYGIDVSTSGRIMAVGYGGAIYHCSQLGQVWNFVQDPSWREFQGVSFTSSDSAVIVGGIAFAKGLILKCDSIGNANRAMQQERNFEMCDVHFNTHTTGFLCGYGAILKTENAGYTWSFTTAENDFFKAMSWKNTQEAIAVGYQGSILKTEDGGNTWTSERSGNNFWKKKRHLLNVANNGLDSYAAVGEKGCILFSKDNGNTWTELNSTSSEDLKGVAFKNYNTLLVTGTGGTILKINLP